MNVIIWIIFCFLASVGVVQVASWIILGMRRPAENTGVYQIIELQRDPELLEAQLRYELFLLRWSAVRTPGVTVLLDPGLEEEARDICRNLLMDASGVVVCSPGELPFLLQGQNDK